MLSRHEVKATFTHAVCQNVFSGGLLAEVETGDAVVDVREDFPRNGSAPFSKFIRGDPIAALSADEHDIIAESNPRNPAYINEHLVHGNASDDRAAAAANEHLSAIAAGA